MTEQEQRCPFFDGDYGVRCNRSVVYPKIKEELGCTVPGEFTDLARVICKQTQAEQRVNDCLAYDDISEHGSSSEFARRISR